MFAVVLLRKVNEEYLLIYMIIILHLVMHLQEFVKNYLMILMMKDRDLHHIEFELLTKLQKFKSKLIIYIKQTIVAS
jgi:hypothetical protein